MTDRNFKALGIDHYYVIGCRDGFYSFDIAYTKDITIAVALRDAFENTWKNHPNKWYRIQGFNGNGTVLEPYSKPHSKQGFWISTVSSFNPMHINEDDSAYLAVSPKLFWSNTFAVCASAGVAKKLGLSLMESNKRFKVMNGYLAFQEELNSIECHIHTGEQINRWFKEGRL